MNNRVEKQKNDNKKESPWGAYVFLLIVLLVYLVIFLFDSGRTLVALQFSFEMLKKLVPILGLVSCFMFLNNLLVKPSWVKNHVGEDSGWKGIDLSAACSLEFT